MKAHSKNAFTLIELLTVIAIIGILAGILIPAVNAVQKNARVASSKATFSNWINMVQLFQQEYGYYPPIGDGEDDRVINLSSDSESFVDAMTAEDDSINKNRVSFGSFSENSFDPDDETQLVDSFGNPDIRIVMDANRDGEIGSGAFSDLPSDEQPDDTLRANVAIYSVPDDAEGFPVVKSWD